MKKVKTIIFDLDGTLVNSGQDIVSSINYSLKRLGINEKKPEFIISCVGYGGDFLFKCTLGEKNHNRLDEMKDVFRKYYSEHLLDNTRLFPGVINILEYYKDKKKIIVSNRITRSIKRLLEGLSISSYFQAIYGGDNGNYIKPSPYLIEKAILEMNITKKDCIMVGDMNVDIESGKAAGVLTCGVTYGIGNKDDVVLAKPDYLIDNISKLKEIVE